MGFEVRHITKTFGTFTALRDVSLLVPDGELVALLGPSGSGKTTLLRIIAGLEIPDEWPDTSIKFNGEDVSRRQVGERRVGFVFQHYALFKHMTVFENIAFGLRVRPRKSRPTDQVIRKKIQQLLHLIQLEGLENRYPSQLSGGQRQRVALARALAVEPGVLLLDEPFGALDAKVRLELRRWLRKLHDELHVTSVFVTHDQDEALEVADRVVVMNQGMIEQVGTPEQVFHRPASEFVMDFLGSVNLFHGRIDGDKTILSALGDVGAVGSDVQKLFVRPFDLIVTRQSNGHAAVPVTVDRVQLAGSVVKADMTDDFGRAIHAELSHERFRELPFKVGDHVFVSPRQARVFEDDFSI